MQQLKNPLDNFEAILSPKFTESHLNKAKAKTKFAQKADDEYCLSFPDENNIETFEKKEVKSDFVKLFKTKTKQENYSLGLHFYFLDREESNYVINVSLQTKNKINNSVDFIISRNFSVEEFKEKLNIINSQLSENNTIENVVNYFKENVLISKPLRTRLNFK